MVQSERMKGGSKVEEKTNNTETNWKCPFLKDCKLGGKLYVRYIPLSRDVDSI